MAEERRLVTILFADIAESTGLGERLDPEDLRALLGRFYAIAREVVTAHGGTLEKFIGDAVMAVFGFPQAHGDDAQRGLSAALEIRDRLRADARLGAQLPIRVGLNTGEVVATRDSSAGDFLITGDAVNVAARLQQAAEPWIILCSERTAQATRAAFTLGPLVEIAAKGKRVPIRAMSLLGRATVAVPPRVPLIGRDDDLTHLELVAKRAFTERRPFLVSLIAPAGTGKTRLLEEFLDRLPQMVPDAKVTIAQCLPYGQRLTYWPLRGVLMRLVAISDQASPEEVRDAIRAWLQDRGVESPGRVAELLAATVGAGETDVTDRASLFAAWRTAIEAEARRSPLVLVFEDLHWSSDSLLDLVESVAHPRADAAMLMIVLARPELLDRRQAWGAGRRNYVALSLEPLSEIATVQLVQHLMSVTSQEIVQRIVARAEGNPFYAGEMVQSIMERVPSLTDAAAVGHALATLPDTVQATVLARLDLLQPAERQILQVGSVFGRTFRAAGIAAVEPDLAPDIDRLTDLLISRDLIRPSGPDRFTFRHILIREVAYQMLPRAERGRLHAGAARWLEAIASGREDALAELIAYHFREAALLTSAMEREEFEPSEIRRKAVAWLKRAGDAAAAAAALVEAARHLRAAIELAAPDDLPELYERLGDVTGGNAGAEAYRTALRLCRDAGRPVDQELRVLGSLLNLYMRWLGSVGTRPSEEEIVRLLAEGEDLVARAQDERAVANFLIANAFYPHWRGPDATAADLADAEASARRGLEIAERLGDARLCSAALDGLNSCAKSRGAWAEAREFSRQRLAFQDRLDLQERMDAYGTVAWALAVLGDLEEADERTASALSILQPGQVPHWALHVAAWRMYTLTLLGRWDEVIAIGERARGFWVETGRMSAGYALHGFIAALDVARARHDSHWIQQYCEVLDEILRQFDMDSPFSRLRPYAGADLKALEAQVARDFRFIPRNRPQLVERVLSLCADRDWPLTADTIQPILEHAAAYRLQVLEGQARRAIGISQHDPIELARAVEIFDRIGAIPYAARAGCERALLTGDPKGLAAGMQVLESLGDLDQLARMERAGKGQRRG